MPLGFNNNFFESMSSILESFHVNFYLLFAQSVNFAIVFFVLYKYVIIPLMKNIKQRNRKIEKGIEDAKNAKIELENAKHEYDEEVKRGMKKAEAVMEEAQKKAEIKKQEIIKKAKDEIGEIITKEKEMIRAEKNKTLKDIKKDVAGLVASSVEKILEQKFDEKANKELIKQIIANK